MTRHDAFSWLSKSLTTYSSEESIAIALQLLSWATDASTAELIAHASAELTPEQQHQLEKALVEVLTHHKPLQYIIGSVPFLSATLLVKPPTLIPRPETEQWVDFIIQELKHLQKPDLVLLDIGTGSGCIAIALAQAFPEAQVYAVDCSLHAIALAQENARLNHCHNLTLIESDLFTQLPQDLLFDCIVSNPPYVTKQEWSSLEPTITQWEDIYALVSGTEGLDIISKIIQAAPSHIKKRLPEDRPVPHLLIEHGEHQGQALRARMKQEGMEGTTHTDLAGKERFTTGFLTDQKRA